MTPEQSDRVRADIAADMRERARLCLVNAMGSPQSRAWYLRMHRALIRQAWGVQRLPLHPRVPSRPLSYRTQP